MKTLLLALTWSCFLVLAGPFGCSTISDITPTSVQASVAFMVGDGLQAVALTDPTEAPRMRADTTVIAQTINNVILKQFQGANAAALVNGSISTFLTLLQSKLSNSKHGATIIGLIKMAQGPATSLLGATASPTAPMSPAVQADAIAFFSGVSQGIAQFVGDPTLNPPVVAPPPPTPPAPTPVAPPAAPPASTPPPKQG